MSLALPNLPWLHSGLMYLTAPGDSHTYNRLLQGQQALSSASYKSLGQLIICCLWHSPGLARCYLVINSHLMGLLIAYWVTQYLASPQAMCHTSSRLQTTFSALVKKSPLRTYSPLTLSCWAIPLCSPAHRCSMINQTT